MQADAEAHLLFFGERFLHCDRALDGVYRAHKVGDDTIASATKDAPTMGCDVLVENGATGGQPAQCADLVLPHKPAIARDIGGEDRRELADRLSLLTHHADKADPFAVRGAN